MIDDVTKSIDTIEVPEPRLSAALSRDIEWEGLHLQEMYCDSGCCMQLPGMHSRRKSAVAYKDAYKIRAGLLRTIVAC